MAEFEKKIIYLHKYFPDLDTFNQIFLSDKILSNGHFEKYLVSQIQCELASFFYIQDQD